MQTFAVIFQWFRGLKQLVKLHAKKGRRLWFDHKSSHNKAELSFCYKHFLWCGNIFCALRRVLKLLQPLVTFRCRPLLIKIASRRAHHFNELPRVSSCCQSKVMSRSRFSFMFWCSSLGLSYVWCATLKITSLLMSSAENSSWKEPWRNSCTSPNHLTLMTNFLRRS